MKIEETEVKKLVQTAYQLGVVSTTAYLKAHETNLPLNIVADAIEAAEYVYNKRLVDHEDREELRKLLKEVCSYIDYVSLGGSSVES